MNASQPKRRRRILMVDDDAELRTTLGWALADEGYEVGHASNGMEALALHRQKPFDVVVIEMVLPKKDGFETLVDLTAHASPPKLIATSGPSRFSSDLYLKMAGHLGAHHLLAKPFQPGQLLAAVWSVLGEV
jgi:DNA-binding response OmpR family regulator